MSDATFPCLVKNTLPVAVCAAVIIQDGQVLITKRPADKKLAGFWEFPGGKIDHSETPHEALKRELAEELAIDVSVDRYFEAIYHRYEWGTALILAYRCTWLSGEIRHLDVADHYWVSPEQFDDFNILPADKPILKKLKQLLA